MTRAKSVQVFKDEAPDLESRIVAAIGKAGPRNVAQIARMTGAHQETIRYKIKKRFGRLGFRFHAEVDFAKLGLNPHWATLKFAAPYDRTAKQVLEVLNEVGYLTYYARLVPQGNFVAFIALPQDTADEYRGFLDRLRELGILAESTLDAIQTDRHKVMDPRFFNFRSGRWEIEWDKVAEQDPLPLSLSGRPKVEDFDYYDLLVIKELQKDSLQHLTGIAKKLKVHQKTLEYHYRTHVQKWKLVPYYRIRWVQDTTKRLVHSIATTVLTFDNLSSQEYNELQAAISKIPFLWSEHLLTNGTYLVVLNVPVTEMVSVTSYINNMSPSLSSKVNVGFVKPAESYAFTIPYNMYQEGRWKFDAKKMENALKKGSSTPPKK